MGGIVVCVHHTAAEEGANVLEAGGNAFDAAVATAFAQMVLMPFSCGVGGSASANLYSAGKGERVIIDGNMRAGSKVSADMWAKDYKGESEYIGESLFADYRSTMGYTSICTPGTVAAFGEMHQKFGTMPWADLLQPAIRIARQGYVVTDDFRRAYLPTLAPYEPGGVERIKATAESARLFLGPDGSELPEGSVIKNAAYANTLERLAKHGPQDFYTGALAKDIAADLAKNGSFVTLDDFREYRTTTYEPNHTYYGKYAIYSNSPPGAGPLLQETLNVLDGLNIGRLEHNGVEHLALLASTFQLVNQDRRDYLGDPEVIGEGPGKVLLSKERAAVLRKAVLAGVIGGIAPPKESQDTTHMTVVDSKGNVASITHTLGSHSGVVTPGMGFVYNDGMNRFDARPGRPSSIAPRKARLHLMMPTIIFDEGPHLSPERDILSRKAGRGGSGTCPLPSMVLGAPGGNGILSALTQTFLNIVEFKMSVAESLLSPRIHAEGSTIWCESRFRTDTLDALRARGFTVVQDFLPLGRRFAKAQVVVMHPDGRLDGGSDPRGWMGVVNARR